MTQENSGSNLYNLSARYKVFCLKKFHPNSAVSLNPFLRCLDLEDNVAHLFQPSDGLFTVHGPGLLGLPGLPGLPKPSLWGYWEPQEPREPLFAPWSSNWCWQVEGQGAIDQRKGYFCKQYTFIILIHFQLSLNISCNKLP